MKLVYKPLLEVHEDGEVEVVECVPADASYFSIYLIRISGGAKVSEWICDVTTRDEADALIDLFARDA